MQYIAEIAGADAGGAVTTLRFANRGYMTQPGETPANAFYDNRITQAAKLQRDMFAGGTSGRSNIGWGEMVLTNIDGALDAYKDYGFAGRNCIVRVADPDVSLSYPGGFTVVMKGTIATPTLDWSSLRFLLRDRMTSLDVPWLSSTYGGTNALPNGLDGVATDLKGKKKPRVLGKVFNISPPCVNTTRLVYQINDGAVADIPAVYDQGASITKGADYATSALMLAAAPAGGTYITCFAEGYFRLGSSPINPVTADVTQGATTASRTVAQCLKQIALDKGIAAGDIDAIDVAALDTANSAEVGVYCADDTTALRIMDALVPSVGAWFNFDRLGTLRMGRLVSPAGTPGLVLDATNCHPPERIALSASNAPDDTGEPAYLVRLNYAKNYTVQSDGLAAAVTTARKSLLQQASAAVLSSDVTVLTQYLMAAKITRDTLLVNAGDAATEAARVLALYKVKREVFRVRYNQFDNNLLATLGAVDLGKVVQMKFPRFGLDAGKLFIVIGIGLDIQAQALDLTLWG